MERQAGQSIDLRGTPCPLNWVKAKVRLEGLEAGQLLEVLLDDGEPIRSVSASIKSEGHRILEVSPLEGGFRLLIERGRAAP